MLQSNLSERIFIFSLLYKVILVLSCQLYHAFVNEVSGEGGGNN